MSKKTTTISVPDVLSFKRCISPSEAYMYARNSADLDTPTKNPLKIVSKTVRGTISNRQKDAVKNDPVKLNAAVDHANIQRIDSCALGPDQDCLKLDLSVKFLGGIAEPTSCSDAEFLELLKTRVKNYADTYGFRKLALRYATNICNGRYLWRNRIGAEKIEIRIRDTVNNTNWTIEDALDISINTFENSAYSDTISEIADRICEVFEDKKPYVLFNISVYVISGFAQEVYPSQEMLVDNAKPGKVLFQENGVPGLHSQKVGNALRSIDTWYLDTEDAAPIAIEPYGSVTSMKIAHRTKGNDFYTLFDKFLFDETPLPENDAHYVMAMLIRGGIFSESKKGKE